MIHENPIIFKKLVRIDSKEKFYYRKPYQGLSINHIFSEIEICMQSTVLEKTIIY